MAKISTRKRGEKWYYSVEATEYALDGKRKRVEKGGFATKKEAMDAGAKALASLGRGDISLVSEKCTVKEFLEEWLEVKKGEVRPTTADNYRTWLSPVIELAGGKPLKKLRPRDVNAIAVALAKRGYAKRSLSVILVVFRTALRYAVYPMEILSANPAQCITVPRNAPEKVTERTVIRQEKLDELLEAFPFGHPMHMPIVIAYHTGMRLGEVLGLAWDAVDLDAGRLSVVRQITYTAATGRMFSPPKTKSSVRTIPIDRELVDALRRWKARQAANEMECGKAYVYVYEGEGGKLWQLSKGQPGGKGMARRALVCTNGTGKALSRYSVCTALKKHGVNSHSFRHTHATICAENGAPAKGLAGRLGHSSTVITQDLYTHETERMQEQTVAAFLAKNF